MDSEGNRVCGDLFAVGSGSMYAYGVVDSGLRYDLTVEEACDLGRRASTKLLTVTPTAEAKSTSTVSTARAGKGSRRKTCFSCTLIPERESIEGGVGRRKGMREKATAGSWGFKREG